MANERGQYGDQRDQGDRCDGHKGGAGGILILLGVTVGIYAISPGARHYYKHGYLPDR